MIKTWISLQFFCVNSPSPHFPVIFQILFIQTVNVWYVYLHLANLYGTYIILFTIDWSSYGVGVCCFLGVYDQTSKTITSVHPPDAGWPCGSSIKFGGIHWSNHDRWPLKKESKGVVSKMCLFTPDFWGKWSNSTVAYFFNGFSTTNR